MHNPSKLVYFTSAILSLAMASCVFANESETNNQSESISSETAWRNDKGEIVISTGPNKPNKSYGSSHVTKSENMFFCNSNTVEVLVESRLDESKNETFKTFNVSAKFNGEKIDILSGKGLPSTIDNFFHIGVEMVCRDEKISVFLTGYNDSSVESGTTLVQAKIDTETGEVR